MTTSISEKNAGLFLNDLKLKIELLCRGIQMNKHVQSILQQQNPYYHKRTGNAGLQMIVGVNKLIANIPVDQKYTELSPYTIVDSIDGYKILKYGELVGNCSSIDPPSWYHDDTSDGEKMGRILLQEGKNTLITAIYNGCDYFSKGKQCRYCSINLYGKKSNSLSIKTPTQISESIIRASSENDVCTIDLTGGNRLRADRGAKDYIRIVEAIRDVSDIPICLEISPPENFSILDNLVDAGVNAFMMNLEIWDNSIRKILCPGKAEISRDHYFNAWSYAQNKIGHNGNVSSVLIAGLESPYSTLEGARNLIEKGVIPSIMPFRPNDGCGLENFVISSPTSLFSLTLDVGKLLLSKNLNPMMHPGCINCTACAGEADVVANCLIGTETLDLYDKKMMIDSIVPISDSTCSLIK